MSLMQRTISAELIDTCWDVNSSITLTPDMLSQELIDTCWDVNTYEMLGDGISSLN